MSKIVDNCEKLNYDGIRTDVLIVNLEGGIKIMTENKMELIRLFLENDNPEQAIMTAAVIIQSLLKQHESSEEQVVACLQVCGQTNPSF